MKCAPFPPSTSRASFLRFALHGCLLLATLAGANAADAKYSVQIALRSALTPPILLEVTGAEGGRAQNLVTKGVVNPQVVIGLYQADETWLKGSVTFVPSDSGPITLIFQGPFVQANDGTDGLVPIFADFDNIVADGAEIANPSFEEVDERLEPIGWTKNKPTSSIPPVTDDISARLKQAKSADGSNFIRVWHNSFYGQAIQVIKDQSVTISFQYRLAPKE